MNSQTEIVFEEIFHNTDTESRYCTLSELETITGFSITRIRGSVEDLKLEGWVIEDEHGVQITESGMAEARTRWID